MLEIKLKPKFAQLVQLNSYDNDEVNGVCC